MQSTNLQIHCSRSINISNSNPSSNIKTDTMYVGYCGYYYRGYIYFDLPEPPQNTSLKSAYLKLYLVKNFSCNNNLYIYPLTESFDDCTNYYNQPSYSSEYVSSSINELPCKWINIDITDLAEKWYNGMLDNYGLFLKTDETVNSAIGFCNCLSSCNCKPKLCLNFSHEDNYNCKNLITVLEKSWEFKNQSPIISSKVNVERLIEGTFFIQNSGLASIIALIEVSSDSVNWAKANSTTIAPNSLEPLVPIYYGKYYRLSVSSQSNINASAQFIYQVYK